jgi:hypothetical protein
MDLSRGLGDVYKRQESTKLSMPSKQLNLSARHRSLSGAQTQ